MESLNHVKGRVGQPKTNDAYPIARTRGQMSHGMVDHPWLLECVRGLSIKALEIHFTYYPLPAPPTI